MTTDERTEFLSGGLRPLACDACGTKVLVKKNSPQHTSIQWTTTSASCPVLAGSDSPALLDTCERLSATIARAALAGELGG
ncbi:hypothetical protein [Amycolatopsis suaedae]|uniref:Ferredoxin n=1 Tax=Amycolatopsis suaedae TaxID=2510978 RepID=A0A4Q7J8B6_9PSEU|nr:hypothetical protein [Amycolatopsis suaedae]RZQ63146.1 hypothetical protein EWH70_15815 [Amycolatopsis suaedae]